MVHLGSYREANVAERCKRVAYYHDQHSSVIQNGRHQARFEFQALEVKIQSVLNQFYCCSINLLRFPLLVQLL